MDEAVQHRTVFVVDDDLGLVRLVEKALQREGLRTASAGSAAEARTWLIRRSPDLALLDLKLPDLDAKDLVAELNTAGRCPPFIIITGQGDERVAVEMMKRGARDYLVKDANFLDFMPAVVKRALEQIENERRLAEAEAQVHLVRSVVDQGFSAVLITDAALPDPKVIYINPAFAQITGYRSVDVIGRPLSAIAGLSNVHRRLRSGLPAAATLVDEISTYQSARGERWGEWRMGPITDKSGATTHWLIIFRDITERRRLEKEILEISDLERRRFGQDLHDDLCQHLAGIELMSQVLEQKLAKRSKTDAARAAEIARHVRDAIGQTRSLARGLSPVTLESEGLVSALIELGATTEKLFGIACRVECPGPLVTQPLSVATHLYRVAQEAVTNAIKHGKGTNVLIRLENTGAETVLKISDNGQGFSLLPPSESGMGLRIMHYRAAMIGGNLIVENGPDGGAIVICSVPAKALE